MFLDRGKSCLLPNTGIALQEAKKTCC